MWGWLKPLFESVIGGILDAWKTMTASAKDKKAGADAVIAGQKKDELKKAKKSREVSDDVHAATDDELDTGMRQKEK